MIIDLTKGEIAELKKTAPADRRKGGFQSYIVELQNRMKGQSIDLSHNDLVKSIVTPVTQAAAIKRA